MNQKNTSPFKGYFAADVSLVHEYTLRVAIESFTWHFRQSNGRAPSAETLLRPQKI